MSEYQRQVHSKHFANFTTEFPQYEELYRAWLSAESTGSSKEAFRLGEQLFHLMRVNGWG